MTPYYVFRRESNNFDDILADNVVKKEILIKISWTNHLMIQLRHQKNDRLTGYIVLKYGDELVKEICKDFSPIPHVDYMPTKDKQ